MASLAFAFPLTPGQAREWRYWGREVLGVRRSEYLAFRRRVGLTAQRVYFQHTPQSDLVIFYLEGKDLQRTFQELRMSQDPFVVWLRQRAKELLGGLDLTHASLESRSVLAFEGPTDEQDEAHEHTLKEMG